MKTFLLLILLSFYTFKKDSPTAYICDNGKTKKYHLDKDCSALKNCTYKIIKRTVEQAKKDGKTLCGKEG